MKNWFHAIPFDHRAYGFLTRDGKVAFTDLTFDEYKAQSAREYTELMAEKDFNVAYGQYIDETFVTGISEITEEQWWDAFECLPPCRHTRIAGVEIFYISEATIDNVHTFYFKCDGKYGSADQRNTISDDALLELWEKYLEKDQSSLDTVTSHS